MNGKFLYFLLFIVLCSCSKPLKKEKSNDVEQKLDEIKRLREENCPNGKCPLVNKAEERIDNYIKNGEGSCSHASVANLFMIKNRPLLAKIWVKKYGSGEYPAGLAKKLDKIGLKYEQECPGSKVFIEKWLNKEPILVSWGPNHMVLLVGSLGNHYYILDPNYPEQLKRYSEKEFYFKWSQYGNWGTVILL